MLIEVGQKLVCRKCGHESDSIFAPCTTEPPPEGTIIICHMCGEESYIVVPDGLKEL